MKINKIFMSIIGLVSINPITRYGARYEFIKWFANKLGFRVYNKNLIWMKDDEVLRIKNSFKAENSKRIGERKFSLYYLAKSVRNVPGDTVECGAYKGEGSYYILSATLGKNKSHYIFDSFGGLSKPDKAFDVVKDKTAYSWEENDLSISLDEVKGNLIPFENIIYHKGWIPEKFFEVKDQSFSFVHVDVDLYQPTLDCFSYFYEKLNIGGIMLCDDYGSSLCPGAKQAFDEFIENKPEFIVQLTTGQGFIVKQ